MADRRKKLTEKTRNDGLTVEESRSAQTSAAGATTEKLNIPADRKALFQDAMNHAFREFDETFKRLAE